MAGWGGFVGNVLDVSVSCVVYVDWVRFTAGWFCVEMSAESLEFLGWDRIRGAWAAECSTEMGRLATERVAFLEDLSAVRATYASVAELMILETRGVRLEFGQVSCLAEHLKRALRGGILDKEPLFEVARTLGSLRRLRKQLCGFGDQSPCLVALGTEMADLDLLAQELENTFDAGGDLRDDASPELAAARRKLTSLRVRTKARLDRFLRHAGLEEFIQDDYYTQREGRFVVPIMASFQHQVAGIIHGASNTGQTVYVEPTEFIEANNELALMEAEVRQAIRKILVERTGWVAEEAEQIGHALSSLLTADQLQGRVRLGLRLNACIPALSGHGEVHLRGARNPVLLLQGAEVVPNDIVLGQDESFVIVTGPNTGGKTVTLATLGSLSAMVAVGLPIPVEPESVLPLFDSVFALGGDRQDVAQDLSTFSGHMVALREILHDATESSLVLLDEIAVGTSPAEGAALAVAVLESLAQYGARGLVTTHYERLKLLAIEDARFTNACVGLDAGTQRPNFELAFGESGSSSPFEVVERLNFPPQLVARARSISAGGEDVSRALKALNDAKHEVQRVQAELEMDRKALAAEIGEAKLLREALRADAEREISRMTAGARAEIEQALEAVRDQVRGIQDVGDSAALEKRRRRLIRLKSEMARPASDSAVQEPPSSRLLDVSALKVGDAVRVLSARREGVVMDVRSAHEVVVSVGPLKLTLPVSDLGPASPPPKAPKNTKKKGMKSRPASRGHAEAEPSYESPTPRTDDITCDLRGMRRDEVADRVSVDLDRAYLDQKECLWIIHGHGTGALRDEVRRLLERSPYPRYSRPGLAHEGGNGVTIVWLDNRG